MEQDYIKVFVAFGGSLCSECGEPLDDLVTFKKDRTPLCLSCADLDHLVFLPSGNTALTRRAKEHSTLSAVVLKFSKARKRNERQGILVESNALEKAELECMADSNARARQRERAAKRREELDQEYVQRFAEQIRKLFPHCPAGTEKKIAEHACLKHSNRVGRCAAAKNFDETAVNLAVIAHIWHAETKYDQFLARGYDRYDARQIVSQTIDDISSKWKLG